MKNLKKIQPSRDFFTLHERLAADSVEVARLGLSRLLLMDERRWPWLILVPERAGASELHDLGPRDRRLLIEEAAAVGQLLKTVFAADKINIGALGNIVPQLHVHVIARHRGDPAWPGPVWGAFARSPYAAAKKAALLRRLRRALKGLAL
jgi:diadenosine tetraphosphate (Ap4A) HIT family hydrolase